MTSDISFEDLKNENVDLENIPVDEVFQQLKCTKEGLSSHEHSEMAEQAKRRAENARLRELYTLKGHVESVVKLKGLDVETMQQHYTV